MSYSIKNQIHHQCHAIKELKNLIRKLEICKSKNPPKELANCIPVILNHLDKTSHYFINATTHTSNHSSIFLLSEISKRIDFFKKIANSLYKNSECPISFYYDILIFINNLLHESIYKDLDDANDRAERKRAASLLRYIMHLKTNCSKLMVIRLDFSYKEENLLEEHFYSEYVIESHWSELLDYVKEKFPSLLGYVAKFEYAVKTGAHIHAIFFMNGSMVRCDSSIGRLLGEHWNNQVTQGTGRYFNCNSPTHLRWLKLLGNPIAVGTFTGKEPEFEKLMKQGLRYLAKPDPCMFLAMPEMKKTFRRGLIKKITS